jgi:hypothetical protein
LQLCGIVSLEDSAPLRLTDAHLVALRDLGALVRHVPFAPLSAESTEVAAYREMLEAVFTSRAVLPAPFGTVFRHRESLLRWMELHYFTLADALRYLDDRQAARVRISRGLVDNGWDTIEQTAREADLEVTCFDSFRVLRRSAVAFLALTPPGHATDDGVEAAFLIERQQWNAFVSAVKDEQKRLPDLRFEQSGPWPPYDFVRLDLNG